MMVRLLTLGLDTHDNIYNRNSVIWFMQNVGESL